MNSEEKEMALTINAMLMSFHYDDKEAFKSMLDDTGDPVSLLVGSIAVLKNMVDSLIQTIDENVDQTEITFESMVQVRGEFLMEIETEE